MSGAERPAGPLDPRSNITSVHCQAKGDASTIDIDRRGGNVQ